jgi:hypothetical protein
VFYLSSVQFNQFKKMEPIKAHTIITALLFCAFVPSCSDEDCCDHSNNRIVGSGGLVTKSLELASFTQFNLEGQGNITITKGDTQKVTLRAQQNILDILTTKVNSGVLSLSNDNYDIQTSTGIFLDIVAPKAITDINITGAGNVNISGAKQDYINIVLSGVGDIDAYNLEVDNCTIKLSGVGNCKVFVDKDLNVSISGVGNVIYKGTPSVTQRISGVGSVEAVN